ncbi:LOW QUALITY PROTEIN: coiled-coil domain-containing protein 186-like [Mya arenaria]|uniref:LOW QUALITY PROTEIN: coiled-coil domain-containing protein 186-like n=1 Tax=Mya arenaria TaxID=6604 RepID=UPI0022DFD2FD|nr:LOW QUALITY PROTEIN: coiled-coil domain-containing protein 186-like [Mya arenaria]
MSDVELDPEDITENPDPESAQEGDDDDDAQNNTEAESEAASVSVGNVNLTNNNTESHPHNAVEGDGGTGVNEVHNAGAAVDDIEIHCEVSVDNANVALGVDNALDDESELLAEGDQGRAVEAALEDSGFNNNFAAEDEQYLPVIGADCSLEPESNIGVHSFERDGGAEGCIGDGQVSNNKRPQAERTESCGQLVSHANQYGAGSPDSYVQQNIAEQRDNGIDAASASGVNEMLIPESEVEEMLNNSGANEGINIEKEPTESDQEDNVMGANDLDLSNEQHVQSSTNNIGRNVVEHVEAGASAVNIDVDNVVESNEQSNENINGAVPEDEMNAVCSSNIIITETDSYQPECDQSDVEACSNQSSPCRRNPIENDQQDNLTTNQANIVNLKMNGSKQAESSCSESESSGSFPHSDNAVSVHSENKKVDLTNLDLSKDKGAIPKRTAQSNMTMNNRNPSSSSDNCSEVNSMIHIDSEDELLSELDATLKDNNSDSSKHSKSKANPDNLVNDESHSQKSAMSNVDVDDKNSDDVVDHKSCDQCVKNSVKCSFSDTPGPKKESLDNPGQKEFKSQMKQAKQLLMDRECEISRLREDISELKERVETVTSERDSGRRELEKLREHNADDLYLPQIKELEYTIAHQQTEIKGLKEKLSSHDVSPNSAIASMQGEMKVRVEQINQQFEEANREKDSMVMKYAQAEHKNLECLKRAERAEGKLRELDKERAQFLEKMRIIKDHRSKVSADLEAKIVEIANLNRELDKSREMVCSTDTRVKWAQNKLKAELDAHKDTKSQLDKMSVKLKEAKEETQQIRRDCQGIIKQYQESEEVKSNSLDKELKQKESELLENQVQKTNFELGQVKALRELETVKDQLKDSKAKLSALQEKLSTTVAGKEQASLTVEKYGELIQKQKKEIQELRERVESLIQYKTDFISAQEMIKSLDTEIAELKITNKELVADMDACRRRETDKLELTAKLSRKNAELQSENTTLSNKVMKLTEDLQKVEMESQDVETKLKGLVESLATEKKLRKEEAQSFSTRLAGKAKAVEDLSRKFDDERDEIKTLKRKHANNVKDLTRQLQQVRRKLENYETTSNGDKDTVSLGSRTSSNGSLNTVGIAEQTNTHVIQPSQAPSNMQKHSPQEQEYPVITEQVEVDKQMLIERIVKLQRAMARKTKKIEFMDDHISQLIDEIQKKNKILQSYILKEEAGTMTSNFRDKAKHSVESSDKIVEELQKDDRSLLEISRKHSIMGSLYSSHSNDGSMTLDLSMEINRKLQAVLEDTILKNMTLKESLDTLGAEIARLSQENRQLQLTMQQKSRPRTNPTHR